MAIQMPESDLSRAHVKEPERDWPDELRIVAQWTLANGKRKNTQIILSRDEYFGFGRFGAPIGGDQLRQKIEHLRRQRP